MITSRATDQLADTVQDSEWVISCPRTTPRSAIGSTVSSLSGVEYTAVGFGMVDTIEHRVI